MITCPACSHAFESMHELVRHLADSEQCATSDVMLVKCMACCQVYADLVGVVLHATQCKPAYLYTNAADAASRAHKRKRDAVDDKFALHILASPFASPTTAVRTDVSSPISPATVHSDSNSQAPSSPTTSPAVEHEYAPSLPEEYKDYTPYVYFIGNQNTNHVRVGYTTGIRKLMHYLKTRNSATRFIAAIEAENPEKLCKQIKRYLEDVRIGNQFAISGADVKKICAKFT